MLKNIHARLSVYQCQNNWHGSERMRGDGHGGNTVTKFAMPVLDGQRLCHVMCAILCKCSGQNDKKIPYPSAASSPLKHKGGG